MFFFQLLNQNTWATRTTFRQNGTHLVNLVPSVVASMIRGEKIMGNNEFCLSRLILSKYVSKALKLTKYTGIWAILILLLRENYTGTSKCHILCLSSPHPLPPTRSRSLMPQDTSHTWWPIREGIDPLFLYRKYRKFARCLSCYWMLYMIWWTACSMRHRFHERTCLSTPLNMVSRDLLWVMRCVL